MRGLEFPRKGEKWREEDDNVITKCRSLSADYHPCGRFWPVGEVPLICHGTGTAHFVSLKPKLYEK